MQKAYFYIRITSRIFNKEFSKQKIGSFKSIIDLTLYTVEGHYQTRVTIRQYYSSAL